MNRIILSAISATVLVACEQDATGSRPVTPLSPPRPAPAPAIVAGFEDQPFVALGFDPTSMEFSPDGRLFVAEQQGKLHVVKDGVLLPTPFVSLAVEPTSERGLLGVAFDPAFATNRFVYVYYTAAATQRNRVSRFTASATNPDVADSTSEVVLLDGMAGAAGYHNGGAIHFGTDGKLYIGVGDSHSALNAQDLTVLEGKLLRINPDGSPPLDNPFVSNTSARPEIWSLGLRNPFTFAVDPGTGMILVNDVGENTWEEIDAGTAGANNGWPTCEGSCGNPSFQDPVYAYQHVDGNCAITGGTFYRGSRFPAEYAGAYFFADFCAGWIKALKPDRSVADFATVANGSVVDLKVGPDGNLYYLSRAGRNVNQISFLTGGDRAPVAVASATPTTGPAPLTVTCDGSSSSDPDGDALTYTWDFGDGSGATGVNASHTYAQNGPFVLALTVSDGRGGVGRDTVLIQVGHPPTGTITLPAAGATYRAGDTISYSGEGSDAEDGTLGPAAFSWTVLFHHNSHTHPFLGPITNVRSGSFVIPTVGEVSDNVWYRIYLTLTDASGLRTTVTRDVLPVKSTFTLTTDPPGLALTLDGQPVAPPVTVTGVVGIERTLGAPLQQTVGGRVYGFASWSDGGDATHTISTPETATTYVATYREVQSGTGGGDADVTTSTTGSNLDPDGYVIVGDEVVRRSIGTNATIRFSAVTAGAHTARLDGVAANCTVSGPNPRTVTVVAGALINVRFDVSCAAPPPPPPPPPTVTRVTGLGAIGPGAATPGANRQSFDFDVTDAPGAGSRVRVVDWTYVRADGTVASGTVDPTNDPSTGITSLARTSAGCVTFSGTARLDTGELFGISIDACDNGSPGTGHDTIVIRAPSLGYSTSGTLTEGDITLTTSSGTQP